MSRHVLLLLVLVFAGCDPSEPGGLDSEALTLTVASGAASSLEPGQPLVLDVEGVALEPGRIHAGRFGDTEVDVGVTDERQLVFFVPAVGSGEFEFEVSVGERAGSARLQVAAYVEIEDSAAYSEAVFEETMGELREILASEPPESSARIEAAIAGLEGAADSFATLAPGDQAVVAYALRRAEQVGTSSALAARGNECLAEAVRLVRERIALNAAIILAGAALGSTGVGGVFGAVTVATGIARLVGSVSDYLEQQDTVLDRCFEPYERLVSEFSGRSKSQAGAGMSSISFVHGVPKQLRLTTSSSIPGDLQAAFADAISSIRPVLEYLPSSWAARLTEYADDLTETAVPPGLALTNLPSNVEGELSRSAGSLTLTFRYQGSLPASAEGFSFGLVDPAHPDFVSGHSMRLEPPSIYGTWANLTGESSRLLSWSEGEYMMSSGFDGVNQCFTHVGWYLFLDLSYISQGVLHFVNNAGNIGHRAWLSDQGLYFSNSGEGDDYILYERIADGPFELCSG